MATVEVLINASERLGLHWWYWNNSEERLTLSPEILRLLGYNENEFDPLNPQVRKRIHPDDEFYDLNRMRRLIDCEDQLYEIEFRLKDEKGKWKWFYNRGSVLSRDENGQGILIGGITMEMAGKYRQLMSRVEENELLYHTLFNTADDPIGLFSNGREIIRINSAYHPTFGYDRNEFLDQKSREMIHPDHREALNVKLAEMAKVIAVESDKLKSAFLANMSHEIRTPMNSIVGLSNLLVKPGLDDASREKYVQLIVFNSELLLALISDIVDLAKIESNQLKLIYGRQKLSSLVGEMKQYAKDELSHLNKTGVEVVAPEVECDCEIETDVIRLSQVMKNLVNNAIKFTTSGKVHIGCKASGLKNHVVLFVEDSGVGISSGNFELIFDQFRQIDGSNTRKFGGMGLGLAICRNLVHMMGGRIWVESTEGEGALFQVELPLRAGLADDIDIKASPGDGVIADQVKKMCIMVVDDEQDSLELFYEILSRMGHEVIKASSGYEALQVMEKEILPDLVFMDDQMAVLSGTETMRIIKERYSSVKVVAQSAHALTGDRARFLREGFDAYLPKRFSTEQLNKILSLLRRN
ncbi:MAG: PAS domain-containing protein [Bacteroidetes bacterium]|nr:PAS domain-containing protein [Bacteroidota bacterium]